MSFSYGKWTKYQMMKEDVTLIRHLPETHLFSEQAFWELIHQYGCVIIKPSKGLKGHGVVKITKLDGDYYEIHSERNQINMEKNELLYYLSKKRFAKKLYIIQEVIALAEIRNCPFDIRVMVEKQDDGHGAGEWKVTGKFAKLAANGYIITNVAQDIMLFDQAIPQSSIIQPDIPQLEQEIDRIAILTANLLTSYYPSRSIIGLDVAITNDSRIAIIEANLNPAASIITRGMSRRAGQQ